MDITESDLGEISINNPAARLLLLLWDIRRVTGGTVAQQFRVALKIPNADAVELISAQQAWLQTVDDVAKQLRGSGNTHLVPAYESQTGKHLKLLLTPTNSAPPWDNFKREFFRDEFISNMLIYATVLANDAPEKVLNEDELAELSKKLTEVYMAVANSSVETPLKNLVLDGLEELRRAIHDYKIQGIAGIDSAIARNATAAVIVSQRPEGPLKKYSEFIRTAAAHATLYHYLSPGLPALTEFAQAIGKKIAS